MIIGPFDTNERVLIVAEIGNNHEGDYNLARKLISHAAETGVDAVKFQTFAPEHYVTSADPTRLKRLHKFKLSHDQFKSLAQQAQALDLLFFSTPFDIESARFLNELQSVFKVASGDNTFFPLLETLAAFGKPTLISTGLADLSLLDKLHELWETKADLANLALLHCVASYPVPEDQANIGAIKTLQARYPDVTIGYSDHTLGTEAAMAAVAAGARIIEKHFTLDKQHSDFRDHQLSADPPEMRRLVESIRRVETILGTGIKEPQPCEAELQTAIRRSIAVARDLPAGTKLSWSDLTWVRPGAGIPPGDEHQVIGKILNCSLESGTLIAHEMLTEA